MPTKRMSFKSIVYTDRVNLENCESEPIHIPGSIQPHGYLLVINQSGIIEYCSENWADLGYPPRKILEKNITEILNEKQYTDLISLIEKGDYTNGEILRVSLAEVNLNLIVHSVADHTILEFEPYDEYDSEVPFLNGLSLEFAREAANIDTLKGIAEKSAEQIKKMTGYDRVMIYRFDEQYNGEVYAESKEEHLEHFLGLHYPHTDIPPQARELYLRNLVRMISDVNYEPVPILTTMEDASNEYVDLSMSVLRSVSPIHIGYLQNMGVGATLTVSIILEGKLWGLIACHHYSPKNLSFYGRISALFMGQYLGSRIRVQEAAMSYKKKRKLEALLLDFQGQLNGLKEKEEIYTIPTILKMTLADGFICASNLLKIQAGFVPDKQILKEIEAKMSEKKTDFWFSNNLVKDLGIKKGALAGLMFFRLDSSSTAYWFRKEAKVEIKWAGNPEKAIVKDDKGLSPRKSFEAWQEIISDQSRVWDEVEIDIAKQGVFSLQKHLNYLRSRQVRKRQEELLLELQKANDELENINWISTHDLKEPLRKIRIFASILMDDDSELLSEKTHRFIEKINNSASRMQRLLDDLMQLNKTKYDKSEFVSINLNELLTEIVESYDDSPVLFSIERDIPAIKGNAVLLSQLFTNLITNTIKFASEDRPNEIKVRWEKTKVEGKQKLQLTFSDNGIGFDNSYAESIFQVFKRAHDIGKEGSGVGLAISKKVVELHGGKISAKGVPQEGATFYITFDTAEN